MSECRAQTVKQLALGTRRQEVRRRATPKRLGRQEGVVFPGDDRDRRQGVEATDVFDQSEPDG